MTSFSELFETNAHNQSLVEEVKALLNWHKVNGITVPKELQNQADEIFKRVEDNTKRVEDLKKEIQSTKVFLGIDNGQV